ncbi:hypothetical protein AB0M97_01920 [Streptomyces sp. NPDC051207]|uniref:hypothetical protein n=1 Tax=Streptomyces sp. NPDC051207 TaxID=3154641 RepID=UPI00341D7716
MDNTRRALAAVILTVVVLATGAAQAVALPDPSTLLPNTSGPLVHTEFGVEGPLLNNLVLPKAV